MTDKVYKVLFIGTHNSARSIIAAGPLNRLGRGHLWACSACSQPSRTVHPLTLKTLERLRAGPRLMSINPGGSRRAYISTILKL